MHADGRRRRFGRNITSTGCSDRSSFKFYFKLSSSKPNESARGQSHKLGVLKTTAGTLRAWHRARTPTLRSVMHGERLSSDIFKSKLEVDSGRESKRQHQFSRFEKVFQTNERFLFNSASQNSEEGIDEFLNRLRKMPSPCKYDALPEEMIRDRIVIGIQDKSTKLPLHKDQGQTNEQVNAVSSQAK